MIRVAVIGAGLIGRQRVDALAQLRRAGRDVAVVGMLDPHNAAAVELASREGAVVAADIDELLSLRPDWVVVATPHDVAARLVPPVLSSGMRVLVEKPLGRSASEAEAILAASLHPEQLWVGLNYRFFPGIAALLGDIAEGRFGELLSMNLVMGHGGSPGDEGTWKLDPERAGGGALIDPGIHLLDLARLVAGTQPSVLGGVTWQGFWGTGIEEECHLLLGGGRVPIINLQVSVVRWRSTFRLEVHGVDGYGIVEGRDRSYGSQTYRRGRRWGWQAGVPQAETEDVVTGGELDVFAAELDALLFPGSSLPVGACEAAEALSLMQLLDACRARLGIASWPAPLVPTVPTSPEDSVSRRAGTI